MKCSSLSFQVWSDDEGNEVKYYKVEAPSSSAGAIADPSSLYANLSSLYTNIK